ncbi:hypothetical protein [Salipaludibacillus sp. CUR1]|nr:hypothetical protein [Salipaludibacillus sp. CUR1]
MIKKSTAANGTAVIQITGAAAEKVILQAHVWLVYFLFSGKRHH